MPSVNSSIPAQEENPKHYTYLKGFRTQQCPDFLQHKCTQHRPFTCFHWHFMNQRRRRPVRKRDGTFNYSPDVYCTKYDETTGICPEGDECPLLHRTAGDTERRYHLRYYKTSVCVHETDSKGFCVKNGPHCAFAHGAHDLRPPVYDVRELQALDGSEKIIIETPLASSVEKDRLINEDPRWNDTNYVLANYKTEPCKRPPRLCRQGYACPSYHNTRDRRRTPKKFKYRSTPCPNVKHGDDWGDPSQCDSGENCPYCHTRTEQQFHPEIYKSTKCNDMVQTGYCPRGPFCAFAHVEQEMTSHRDVPTPAENSLAAFVTNALPQSEGDSSKFASKTPPAGGEGDASNNADMNNLSPKVNGEEDLNSKLNNNNNKAQVNLQDSNNQSVVISSAASVTQHSDNQTNGGDFLASSAPSHLPQPIGKGRTNSISGSVGSDNILSSVYLKAPGSEREDTYANLRKQLQAIETDTTLDKQEKSKRKHNLLLLHNLNIPNISGSNSSSTNNGPLSPSSIGVSLGTNITSSSFPSSSTMSPNAKCFYPPCDTVESVVGNALEEDLNLGELSLSSIDREMARDNDNDTNSVCSSMSAGFSSSAGTGYIGASSVPVTIPSHPGAAGYRGSISSLSPASSPIGSLGTNFLPHIPGQHRQEQQLHDAAAAFLSQPNPGKYSAPSYGDYNSFNGMSPRSNVSQSPLLSGSSFAVNGYGEVQRLREELSANKAKLAQWEDGISQARSACEAWKKEADEANRKAKLIDEERHQYLKQRDEAIQKITLLQKELEKVKGGTYLHCLQRTRASELDSLPIQYLQQLQVQLRVDLDSLEKVLLKQTATIMKCLVCKEKNRSVAVMPCNHYVMCETCATSSLECPYCHSKIQQKSSVLLPL